jgi:transcriptional regulator with XRE-family HTH domain
MREQLDLRTAIGDVLRQRRVRQGRTLRQVSAEARVSLGYISEIERGQKEASSEMLGALCEALQVPLSSVLREVSDRLVVDETSRAYAKAAQSGAETRLLALAIESSEQVVRDAADTPGSDVVAAA